MNSVVSRRNISHRIRAIVSRPFFVLLGGAGFAQLITFLGAPFLTRLYSPEAFGMLALFGTSLSVAGAVAGGRYEQAIIGETVDESADGLVLLVATFALCFSALLPIALPTMLSVFNVPATIKNLTIYLIPATFSYAVTQAFTSWLIRKGCFPITSFGKVLQAVTVLGASLLLVGSGMGLVVASTAGYIVAAVVLAYGAWRTGWMRESVKVANQIQLVRRYIKFPLIGTLPALSDTLSMLLPVYCVAIYFSASDTGQFGLSRQVFAAPLGMVSLVVTQLLMKRLADAKAANTSMLPILRQILLLLCWPVLGLGIAISLIGPELFVWVFGDMWRHAGILSSWMVWAYVAPMIVSPLSSVLIVLRRVGSNGAWQLMHCAGVLLIVSFGNFANIGHFVKVLVIFELFSYGVYALLIAHATYGYEKHKNE